MLCYDLSLGLLPMLQSPLHYGEGSDHGKFDLEIMILSIFTRYFSIKDH
jgi:hypothetical protein